MRTYKVYRLNYTPGLTGADKSFEKSFTSYEECYKYVEKQKKLLIEFEGLSLGNFNPCMATFFYEQELRTILVLEVNYE